MADDRLRERERRARSSEDLEDRQAWLIELIRTRAPEAREASALQERIAKGLEAVRQAADERFNSVSGERTPAKPCPELSVEPVLIALETALRDRDGLSDVGYGTETLISYWPRGEARDSWFGCGVIAFAARLGDAVTLAVNYGVASKPTPGSAWQNGSDGLGGWRESLKPETKEAKLRAWVAAGSDAGFWETLTLERARLAVDLIRLQQAGGLQAPAPIAKKGDVAWRGVVRGVQPRLKVQRPYAEDEYFGTGYALRLEGPVDGVEREFVVGIGEAAQTEHRFHVGDVVTGVAKHVEDPASVPVDFYRASKLVVEKRGPGTAGKEPPWYGPGPKLEKYRAKHPRKLAAAALGTDPCKACYWGCRLQTDSLPGWDHPLVSVCFGPTSCPAFVPPDGVASGTAVTPSKPARKAATKKISAKKPPVTNIAKTSAKKVPSKKAPSKNAPSRKPAKRR